MNYEEFAFLNRQLAGMLQAGIPLEGALRQLAATMQAGRLRTECEQLGAELAQGTPLREALARRSLPPFYVQMVQLGAAGNDLPGLLTLLADYYQRRHNLWTRLKGLLVYPALVLTAALALSAFVACLYSTLVNSIVTPAESWPQMPAALPLGLWLPLCWLAILAVLFALAISLPACRDWLRWRLPAFRESSLAQFAATMRLLLQSGGELRQALSLVRGLESGTRLGAELERWQQRLATGQGKFTEVAGGGRLFPRLFVWLVGQGGEDLAAGFARAAEVYYERARYRVEMLLYAALPVAVLILGLIIFIQANSMVSVLVSFMNGLGAE